MFNNYDIIYKSLAAIKNENIPVVFLSKFVLIKMKDL